MLHDIIADVFPLHLNPALVFGLLILVGVCGGILASRISWLPTITGFMLVGVVLGPSILNIFDAELLAISKGFVEVALGLILFKLGSAVHPKEILVNPRLVVTSVIEVTLTFLAVIGVLYLFDVPPIVSLLVASIFVSSSPAILVHVANEVGAAGRVTNSAKSLVALNNVLSFILFTSFMPFALQSSSPSLLDAIGLPLYRLFGSLVVGTAVAYAVTKLTKLLTGTSTHFIFPIVIGAIMVTLGLSSAFQFSFLFAALTLGVATRWMELKYMSLTKAQFGYGEDIFFIILFVTAGANLHLSELLSVGLVAPCLIVARCLAKFSGVALGGRMASYTMPQASARGLLLLPMAGLAIGLVQTTQEFAPAIAAQVAALVIAAVAVLESVGPPVTKVAFEIAGETGKDHPAEGNVSRH